MPNLVFSRAVKFYRELAEIKPRYARALALLLWLSDGGARRGGAVNLRWTDIDLSKQTAVITEKGNKTRKVWFGISTKAALIRWKLAQNAHAGGFVFSPNGAKITAACLAQYFRRRCVEAGIGSWGPHSLRHRFGVRLRENKTPSHVAALVMGISLKTYEGHYGEPDEDALKKAAMDVSYGSEFGDSEPQENKSRFSR
jgi:integrase